MLTRKNVKTGAARLKIVSGAEAQDETSGVTVGPFRDRIIKGMTLVIALVGTVLFFTDGGASTLTTNVLSSAYFSVTLYVAVTMIPIQILGYYIDFERVHTKLKVAEIPFSALLGALPGCGGAIIVTSAFAKGRVSFGAVVAVLTATMGDAAFLFLAKAPETLLQLMAIGFIMGTLTGFIVNFIHDKSFLRPEAPVHLSIAPAPHIVEEVELEDASLFSKGVVGLWFAVGIAGLCVLWFPGTVSQVIGIEAANLEPSIGILGIVLSLIALLHAPKTEGCCSVTGTAQFIDSLSVIHRVTIWVVGAFLCFEVLALALPFATADVLGENAALFPLMGALVGLLPSCGPQVVLSELFLRGSLNFPALVANAVSNDGDALFPMIAIAPRAALIASVYTIMPALLVGYLFHFLG